MEKFMSFYWTYQTQSKENSDVILKILTFKWEGKIEFQTHLFFFCFTKHLLSTVLLNVLSYLKYDLLFLVYYLWHQYNFHRISSTVISFLSPVLNVILYFQLSNIFLFLFSTVSLTCTFPFFSYSLNKYLRFLLLPFFLEQQAC